MASTIEGEGVETELFWIGKDAIKGCEACFKCSEIEENRCVFDNGAVNEFIKKAKTADGFVFATPVYFSAPNGALVSFLDRVFFAGGSVFKGKPGALITVARRAGTVCAYDVLSKYLPINGMPIAGSMYWPITFGQWAGDVLKDAEGMQTVTMHGRNLVWLMKCIKEGEKNGINAPELNEEKQRTCFIR